MHTIFLILIAFSSNVSAAISKTPGDVYAVLQQARVEVEILRQQSKVKRSWPVIKTVTKPYPRHVLMKCDEVLVKLNRLRKIKRMGEVTIPVYPSRNITPDDVYDMSVRMLKELRIVTGSSKSQRRITSIGPESKIKYEMNYQLLSEISRALDPVLGIEGFTPADVHALTGRVVANALFLRTSQNLPEPVEEPDFDMRRKRHPNHALMEVYETLSQVSQLERNLWMEPCEVPKLKSRKIGPNEVYDAVLTVMAELQRIKYRLGLEYRTKTPKTESGKTPNDVIYNLKVAQILLPPFDGTTPLQQHNPEALQKKPADVFIVAERITKELEQDRKIEGITLVPRKAPLLEGNQPKHIYQKTLECLEKVNRLRKQTGFFPTAIGDYPLREITLSKVYELVVRLDDEFDLLQKAQHGRPHKLETDQDSFIGEKTHDDVYQKIWQVSFLLDTIIGPEGYSPVDVYREAQRIIAEVKLLQEYLNVDPHVKEPPFQPGKTSGDVIIIAQIIINLIGDIQRWANMKRTAKSSEMELTDVTPNEVYNEVGIILSEIISLKIHLNLFKIVEEEETPSHVYQKMVYAHRLLQTLFKKSDYE